MTELVPMCVVYLFSYLFCKKCYLDDEIMRCGKNAFPFHEMDVNVHFHETNNYHAMYGCVYR